MKIKYLNFSENDKLDYKVLCKFLPLERALHGLKEPEHPLWFPNPETWTDPYESYFLNNSFNNHDCILKNRVWASCFTTKGRSEAQWNAYSEKELAVMLELDAEKFIETVSKKVSDSATIYVGKVDYVPTGRIKKTQCSDILGISQPEVKALSEEELCIRLMLLKRMPFQYENEIRIFIVFEKDLDEEDKKGGFVENVLDKSIVNKVVISPNAKDYTRELLRDHIKGLGYKVSCHKLYDKVTNQVITF